ncbi:MAG TPA: RecX family transcriptional regulator [Blastocatellia bacterium]|nr:RecX family transcriptional regulator [Blastocatellia bacterium]
MKGRRGPAKAQRRGPEQSPAEKMMAAALRMISIRSYSEGELRDRLERRSAGAEIVDECIRRLKELGYVNDELFAHSYASYRVRSRPLGRARLAHELAIKKVSPKRINEALDLVYGEVGEEQLIDRAIGKRIRKYGRPADRASAKRMFDHLVRLGFEYDLILRKLNKLKAKTESD